MGWLRRFGATLAGSRLDDRLDEELRFHLDQRTEDLVRRGMTPGEARREALRRFGNLPLARERTRDRDTLAWLDTLTHDFRDALRSLVRSPGNRHRGRWP